MSITTNSGERWNNTYTPAERLEITFGVFFDGTLNNIKNIEARGIYEEYKEQYEQHIEENGKNDKKILSDVFGNDKEKKLAYEAYEKYKSKELVEGTLERDGYDYRTRPDDVSYENDYTNPARLFKITKDEDYRIYIEGSGSLNYQEDRTSGMAFGDEESGVRAKVRKGCKELAQKIADEYKNKKNASIIYVNVDTYGFSRGAAGARNFIHEITRRDGIVAIAIETNPLKIARRTYSLYNSRGFKPTKAEIMEVYTASEKQEY